MAGEAKPATMAGFLFAEAGPRFAATLAYSLAVGQFRLELGDLGLPIFRYNILKTLVPAVWIEQTTYRLQGGCSTAELSRHATREIAEPGRRFNDRDRGPE